MSWDCDCPNIFFQVHEDHPVVKTILSLSKDQTTVPQNGWLGHYASIQNQSQCVTDGFRRSYPDASSEWNNLIFCSANFNTNNGPPALQFCN